MKYCSECGQKLNEKENFCSHCGHNIKDSKTITNQNKTNKPSLVGFICSFFLTITPIILCIIGLVQTKRTKEDGKGFAIAGLIISAIKLISLMLIIVFLICIFSEIDFLDYEPDYCEKAICDCKVGTRNCECKYIDNYNNEYSIYCDIDFERA